MKEIRTLNAIITRVSIIQERGYITATLYTEHECGHQGFGNYCLYNNDPNSSDFTGIFIWNCLKIAGVETWNDLVGKPIRIKQEHSKIHAIGHIIKDEWFDPAAEFEALNTI